MLKCLVKSMICARTIQGVKALTSRTGRRAMVTGAATAAGKAEDSKHHPPEKSETTDVSDPFDIIYTTRCEEEGYGVIYSCDRKNYEIDGQNGLEKKEVEGKDGCVFKADGRGEC